MMAVLGKSAPGGEEIAAETTNYSLRALEFK
jgi:hypothetical protein